MSCRFFISHAVANKEIANAFKDFLILASSNSKVGVSADEIFCSSYSDIPIDASSSFMDSILPALKESKYVICLISETFLERPNCLLEMGMGMLADKNIYLEIPPVTYKELPSFLSGVQTSGPLNNREKLIELKFKLFPDVIEADMSARNWCEQCDSFLEKIRNIEVPSSSMVARAEFNKVLQTVKEVICTNDEKEQEITRLKNELTIISKLKDVNEVKKVSSQFLSAEQQYEKLIVNAKKALAVLPRAVRYAIYTLMYQQEETFVYHDFDISKVEIRECVRKGFMDEDLALKKNNSLVNNSLDELNKLEEYIEKMPQGFYLEKVKEIGCELELRNQIYWESLFEH